MRRLSAFLVLSFALAVPAAAQPGRIAVVEPAKTPVLRGSIPATPAPVPEETPLLLPLPARQTSIGSSPTDGARCRTDCSRQYYVCLAGEDDNCPNYWSRCVSGCAP